MTIYHLNDKDHFSTKSAKVKASYSREKFAVDADTDIQVTGPIVRASAVFM